MSILDKRKTKGTKVYKNIETSKLNKDITNDTYEAAADCENNDSMGDVEEVLHDSSSDTSGNFQTFPHLRILVMNRNHNINIYTIVPFDSLV